MGDGVDAPRRHLCAKMVVLKRPTEGGVRGRGYRHRPGLAKQVFHLHGAAASGARLFSKRVSRTKLIGFFASQRRSTVAIEACAGSHYWPRELQRLGHEVRLIPPAYLKPFVKRQKNDAADAEAICEAAQRPSMRFVPVKSEES